jgi:hypothetical protein
MISDDGMVLMRVLTVVARDIDFGLFKIPEIKNALKHLMDNYSTEDIDKAFAGNEEWKEEILDRYDGDMSELKNFDVFEDTCAPDFCGIHLLEPPSENAGEYFVGVGPE